MGVLSTLSSLFPGWRTVAPGTPANVVANDLPSVHDKPIVSTAEKLAVTLGAGMAGQIQFLPYINTTTGDTPAVRDAMRQMLKDPYVKAAWLSQVFAVASEEFQVNAYDDDDPIAQEHADFIRDGIDNLPLGSAGLIISLLLPLGPDGVSIVEPVTEVAVSGRWAGKWVPFAAKAKDIQYLYLLGDRYRNILSIRSVRSPELGHIDAVDFLITKYAPLFEEPFGWAAFRSSYQEWWMLDTVRKLRGLHHEKRSSGTLVGTFTDKASKLTLEDTMKKLKNSTWAVVPEGVVIQALELSKASDTDYAKFEQDKIVGVVTGIAFAELQMLSGDTPSGRGNSQVHQATADLAKWYLAKLATETINRQFIRRYVDWNFSAVQGYPRFSLGGINPADVLAEMDQLQRAQAIGFDGRDGRPALSIKHYARTLSLQLADPRDPTDRLALAAPAQPGGFGLPSLPPSPFDAASAFAELRGEFRAFAEEIRSKKE